MTYWSLRALGNSAFPIAFSQEPLQPVIARKLKATLNKPSKISAQTWMTQFFGLLCLSRGPFGQFAGR